MEIAGLCLPLKPQKEKIEYFWHRIVLIHSLFASFHSRRLWHIHTSVKNYFLSVGF